MQNIVITGIGSISALGNSEVEIWNNYKGDKTLISDCCLNNQDLKTGKLSSESEAIIKELRKDKIAYRKLDKSVLMAIYSSRIASKNANWKNLSDIGVNIGSSRGATSLFEKYHKYYIESKKRLSPLSSPTTTLGNISSWVAMDLGSKGTTLSHSITCSTALHSILNACIWIESGRSVKFLAGGSEAPLTDFTIAQMQALGIYSSNSGEWPCNPLATEKEKNSMILGEGSTVFALEKDVGQKSLAKITGIGYATEMIEHNASLSAEADCIQSSMKMALKDANLDSVDGIVMHAPGTTQGDNSEWKAVNSIFKQVPIITINKHLCGHTLGNSGAISLEMAVLMMKNNSFINIPYNNITPKGVLNPKTIMVNAVGFGGNAVSIILQS